MRPTTLTLLALLSACASAPAPAPEPVSEAEFKALHELRTDAPPALRGSMIDLDHARAYLSLPEGARAPLPGVVVIHEWWGLNDNIKHWADRLAAEGHAALAVDLYGGTVATNSDEAMAAMRKVDTGEAKATLLAAHRFLTDDERVRAPRTASIGWCFGGAMSLQLAMSEPALDAAVIYYGRLVTEPAQLAPIRAPILGIFGTQDRSIPMETVKAFEEALVAGGKDVRILAYDAQHAFANPSSARYDEENAAKAWKEARAFLRARLRP